MPTPKFHTRGERAAARERIDSSSCTFAEFAIAFSLVRNTARHRLEHLEQDGKVTATRLPEKLGAGKTAPKVLYRLQCSIDELLPPLARRYG